MKYHIKNRNSKKEMKKVRMKSLPLELMNDSKRSNTTDGNKPLLGNVSKRCADVDCAWCQGEKNDD